MGAKGALAPPVFIILFQPKVFHCLLENLTKKNTLPPMGFLKVAPSEFSVKSATAPYRTI
jgi:hypothetical protein